MEIFAVQKRHCCKGTLQQIYLHKDDPSVRPFKTKTKTETTTKKANKQTNKSDAWWTSITESICVAKKNPSCTCTSKLRVVAAFLCFNKLSL